MYLSEDYNSPQSPYWCLKSLIIVALSDIDDFWTSDEVPYPKWEDNALLPGPEQILCNHPKGNHHFMLTPGQFVGWPLKATHAKYCKFAYSSAFAFSVPTGPLIQQIAPDSTLALSRDGAETWTLKWKCSEVQFMEAKVHSASSPEVVRTAKVRWYPWGDRAVAVDTTLVPPTARWPDWHVRVHRIMIRERLRTFRTVGGGFAIFGREQSSGRDLPRLPDLPDDVAKGFEGVFENTNSTLIVSSAGASGIYSQQYSRLNVTSGSKALKPDANTNLACQRTLIPTASHDIREGLVANSEIIIVESVFGIATTATTTGKEDTLSSLRERWTDVPAVCFDHTSPSSGESIVVSA